MLFKDKQYLSGIVGSPLQSILPGLSPSSQKMAQVKEVSYAEKLVFPSFLDHYSSIFFKLNCFFPNDDLMVRKSKS